MKTRMVEECEGEYLGPIDWAHPSFAEYPDRVALFRKLADAPDDYLATTDGGWPKFGFYAVYRVGMYDGRPYWKPYPSFCSASVLGSEWHSWHSLTELMPRGGLPEYEP